MREAMLYEKLAEKRTKCNICQWRCVINPGKTGICRVYQNQDGTLHNLNYAHASSLAADPVEKKPLFHFFPGSLALSIGSWGCNFHCQDCQNWEISCEDGDHSWHGQRQILPEDTIEMAKNHHCAGIAWTYNEPSVWFEYTLDSAKIAKKNGLYTIYVTNGFLTPEALDTIGPYLDVWRVDIKGFTDTLYRRLARVDRWQGILDVTKRAREKWQMHVEVITNIIPTMNDDDEQLKGIAEWIVRELGELTPWHVTRFYPCYNLDYLSPTPISTLEHAYDIGKEAGLRFVYVGNTPGHQSESTVCYSCGRTVVERTGYQTRVVGLNGSRCAFCGAELNFRTSQTKEVKNGG